MTNESQPTMNDIGTSIAYTIIICIIITYSTKTFHNQINYINYLMSNSWQIIETQISSDYSINVFKFRDGSKKLYLNHYNELLFSKNCDIQLQYICQLIENNKINIQSFYFYIPTTSTKINSSSFYLKDIAFIDKTNNVQIFPYTNDAPNNPKLINTEKQNLLFSLIETLIFYIFLVLLSFFSNFSWLFKSEKNQINFNYIRISIICLSYFYLVGLTLFFIF